MRAACRNCRLHHAKRNFKPPKAPGRRAPLSSRIPVTLVIRTAAPSNRTSHPAFTSQTSYAVLWRRRSGAAYTSWLSGAKEESKGLKPLECSSTTRVTEGAQGSGLNSKMAASRKLAARRGLAVTPFGQRFDRPDLMCAAQHPEFDRCATNPAPFV